MKTCPECGIEIFVKGATQCKKCGALFDSINDKASTETEDDKWELSEEHREPNDPDETCSIDISNAGFEEASKLQEMLEDEFDSAGDPVSGIPLPDDEDEKIISRAFGEADEKMASEPDPASRDSTTVDDDVDTIIPQSTIEHYAELASSEDTEKRPFFKRSEHPKPESNIKNLYGDFPRPGFEASASAEVSESVSQTVAPKNITTLEQKEPGIDESVKVQHETEAEATPALKSPPPDMKGFYNNSTSAKTGTGVAYISGQNIRFIGSGTYKPGDQVTFNGKGFKLKESPPDKRKKKYIWPAISIIAMICGLFVLLIGMRSGSNGSIAIMPLDAENGDILKGATAIIDGQVGKKLSRPDGFIAIDDLSPGIYTIILSVSGYDPLTIKDITVTKAGFVTLSPKLTPKDSGPGTSSGATSSVSTSIKSVKKTSRSARGAIKINVKPDYASFTIDGKVIGIGNQTYTNIWPGKRVLRGHARGYRDFTRTIRIKPGQTHIFNYHMKLDINAKIKNRDLSVSSSN